MTASLITNIRPEVVIIDIKFLGTIALPAVLYREGRVYMMGTTVDMQRRAKKSCRQHHTAR